MTLGQLNILVDREGHARLTNFKFTPIVPGMSSARQGTGRTAALAAPEILQGTDMITREVDVFAFGMVLIEVGARSWSHLTLEVEGWMVHLISECCLRFLQEGLRSVNSQHR